MPETELTVLELEIPPEGKGSRVDAWLASHIEGLSRNRLQALIRSGAVRIDGEAVKVKHRLNGGEKVVVEVPPPAEAIPDAEAIPLTVVYEDEWLIVIDKQPGLVVHPAPGHSSGTLVNALLHHCDDLSGIGGERRPGIVHRLDQFTSGLMVAAKNDAAHQALSEALARREVSRRYIVVSLGQPREPSGKVDAPIGRSRSVRVKMAIDPRRGREAVTHWEVDRWGPGVTVLKIKLETGRTHQIRVHLNLIALPVIGDPLYGVGKKREIESIRHEESRLIQAISRVKRQQLHAVELEFLHPKDGKKMQFEAPIPEDMAALIEAIRPLEMRSDVIAGRI